MESSYLSVSLAGSMQVCGKVVNSILVGISREGMLTHVNEVNDHITLQEPLVITHKQSFPLVLNYSGERNHW